MFVKKCIAEALGALFTVFAGLYRLVFIHGKIRDFRLFERKIHSQNGEDGIIRAIFDKIGTTNRFCVEFGIHPAEGNTILLREQGWNCLWMDGGGDGQTIRKEFITAENINDLFAKYGVPRDLDLLSIDIDSNDYWVWKAITDYAPRVVVIEYNASIPPTESRTVEYDPSLRWDGTDYYGASLLALERLGRSKGYTLITCDRKGINAFFVRSELVPGNFRVRDIADIYMPPGYGEKVDGVFIGHRPSGRPMRSV
jgi:hypothetical protein